VSKSQALKDLNLEGGILLRIRLTRMGAKKKPFYRVVVTERRHARDGRFVEIVGHYNPGTNPPSVELDMDRLKHWMAKGAQPSETVSSLLKKAQPATPAS
jgi:small subunit ribosomal protein S16